MHLPFLAVIKPAPAEPDALLQVDPAHLVSDLSSTTPQLLAEAVNAAASKRALRSNKSSSDCTQLDHYGAR